MEVEFYGCAKSLGLDSCHNCVGSEIVTIFQSSCYISLSKCLIYLPWLYGPLRALASWITDAHSSLLTAFSRHLLTCISRRSFGTSSSYRNLHYHHHHLLLLLILLLLLLLLLLQLPSGLLWNIFWIQFTLSHPTSWRYVSILLL
jgi:hypothetical protein